VKEPLKQLLDLHSKIRRKNEIITDFIISRDFNVDPNFFPNIWISSPVTPHPRRLRELKDEICSANEEIRFEQGLGLGFSLYSIPN